MKAGKNGGSRGSSSTPPPRAAATKAAREASAPDDQSRLAELVSNATRYVKELAASAKQMLEIQAERKKLALRRGLMKAAVGVVALVAVVAWLGAAIGATVRGLCTGLAVLFDGRQWLGDLVGGLLALALLAGAVALALRRSARKDLERLEEKYGRLPDDEPPEDTGRVPRPDRSGDAQADLERDAPVR
jgi:hypothetical protein